MSKAADGSGAWSNSALVCEEAGPRSVLTKTGPASQSFPAQHGLASVAPFHGSHRVGLASEAALHGSDRTASQARQRSTVGA